MLYIKWYVINYSCYKMICNNVINVIKIEFLFYNIDVYFLGNWIIKLICISYKKYKSIYFGLILGNDMY